MIPAMKLLAIDTALEACSVGVAAGGGLPVLRSEIIGRGHAERLFGMLSDAMAEAGISFDQLDRIAVTTGPGSFTGVRVGIAAARGLALVTGCPVVGLGTLDVIAEAARAAHGAVPVLTAIDARRDEVYAQAFAADGTPLSEPTAGPAANTRGLLAPGMLLAGSGAALIAAALESPPSVVTEIATPDLSALMRLAASAPSPAGPPRPLYLRPPDAKPQAAFAVARR